MKALIPPSDPYEHERLVQKAAAPAAPIFSLAGGKNYTFTAEASTTGSPRAGAAADESPTAPLLKVRFSLEVTCRERDLVQEPKLRTVGDLPKPSPRPLAPPQPRAPQPVLQPRQPQQPQQPPKQAPRPPAERDSPRRVRGAPTNAPPRRGAAAADSVGGGSGGISARTSARAHEVEQQQRQAEQSRQAALLSNVDNRYQRYQQYAARPVPPPVQVPGGGGGPPLMPYYAQLQPPQYALALPSSGRPPPRSTREP